MRALSLSLSLIVACTAGTTAKVHGPEVADTTGQDTDATVDDSGDADTDAIVDADDSDAPVDSDPPDGDTDADTDPPTPNVPRQVTSATGDLASVVAGNEAFHWEVYKGLTGGSSDNLFVSTFSMSAAFGMSFAGAAGGTHDEMATALHVDVPDAQWHAAFGALIRDLSGDKGRPYTLEVANRMFAQPGVSWAPDFVATCTDAYGAPLIDTDFAADPETARTAINGWVKQRTRDRIVDIVPAGGVTSATELVLVNAIYFLGNWEHAFDPADTRTAPFSRVDGSTVDVPLMHFDTETHDDVLFQTTSDTDVDVARLPYKGGDLSLLLVVPKDPKGLADVEASMDAGRVQGWVDALTPTMAIVAMPKLELRTKVALGGVLADLGMQTAFTSSADFSAMTTTPNTFALQEVWHEAFVRIDEVGTEAAAATAGGIDSATFSHEVIADHPFLFLIRDELTGTTLFSGRVMDPTAQ